MVKNLFNTAVFFDPKGRMDKNDTPIQTANSQKIDNLIREYKSLGWENEGRKKSLMKQIAKLNDQDRKEMYDRVIKAMNDAENKSVVAWQNNDKDGRASHIADAGLYREFRNHLEQNFKKIEKVRNDGYISIEKRTKTETSGLKREISSANVVRKGKNGKMENTLLNKDERGTIVGKEKLKDSSSKVEFDKSGKITTDALIAQLSDLDGKSGVEARNVNIFSQILGKNGNKFNIGEAQVRELLKGKNESELRKVYARVTGDNSPLDLQKTKDGTLSPNTVKKFENFRKNLIEKSSATATLAAAMLNDVNARTGLTAVLEGTEKRLLDGISDPQNLAKFLEQVRKSEVIKRDKNILNKIASAVLKIGINLGVNIASAGIATLVAEQTPITHETLTSRMTKENLSYTLAAKDAKSIKASIDAVGVRFEWNWNDPQTAMASIYQGYLDAPDKQTAMETVVKKISEKLSGSLDKNAKTELTRLTDSFRKEQLTYINNAKNLDAQGQKKAIDNLGKSLERYLGNVFSLKGFESKGVFLSANLNGLSVGLTGASVEKSSTDVGMKIEAGNIAASLNEKKNLSDADLKSILKTAGITEKDGKYYLNGEELVKDLPAGKKLQFHVQRVVGQEEIYYTINYKTVSGREKGFVFTENDKALKEVNNVVENEFIKNNPKAVADYMLFLRRYPKRNQPILEAISSGNYIGAVGHLETALSKVWTRTYPNVVAGLKNELQKVKNNTQQLQDFMDSLLAKSSGGIQSREMAKLANQGVDITKKLRNYYENWVAENFAKQYGLNKGDVMNILNQMIAANNGNMSARRLGNELTSGYTGLVAFAQKWGLRGLDAFNHNAQVAGTTLDVTSASFAEKIRAQLQAKISPNVITKVHKLYPELSDTQIRQALAGGNIKAALSYEPKAECYNLMFVVEPLTGERAGNTIASADVMGADQAYINTLGLGLGINWNMLKKKSSNEVDKPNTKPKKEEVSNNPARTDATEGVKVQGTLDVKVNVNTPVETVGKVTQKVPEVSNLDAMLKK